MVITAVVLLTLAVIGGIDSYNKDRMNTEIEIAKIQAKSNE